MTDAILNTVDAEIWGQPPEEAVNLARNGKNVYLVKLNAIEYISDGVIKLNCTDDPFPVPEDLQGVLYRKLLERPEFRIVRIEL